jgi:hypothetical protein
MEKMLGGIWKGPRTQLTFLFFSPNFKDVKPDKDVKLALYGWWT